MDESRLWTKDFIIITLTNLFVALTFYLLMTTLTVYAVEQFQASQSMAGFASSIFIIGAVFSRLFTGKYIEVIGRKKLLRGSLVAFFIATLLYFPVHNLGLFLVVRIIHGVGFGIAATTMSTAMISMIPRGRRGEGIGYYSLSSTAATAIGPFLGLFITQHADFDMIFVCSALFSIASIVIILFCRIPEADLTKDQLHSMRKGYTFKDFFEVKAIPISFMMIFMGIAYSGIVSFLNSYAIDIQLTDAASYYFLVYALFLFVSRPLTGRLLDRKGDNIVIYPSLLIFSISLLLLSQVEQSFTFLLTGVLSALGFGTLMSSAQAIAIKVSPKDRVGLTTSTFFVFLDSGVGIGPLLLGLIVPLVSFRGMYMLLSIVVFLSIGLYYFVHGRKQVRL